MPISSDKLLTIRNPGQWKREWIYLGFCVLGLALYWDSLPNAFVFDDEEQILANPLIHSLDNIPAAFAQSTMNSGGGARLGGVYYKPLMTSFYALLWAVAGPSPFWFHLFQLAVHIVNSILVFRVFRFFFRDAIPLVLGLVFLLHPINTECVVYSADLQDALYLLFGLLGLRLCLRSKRLGWSGGAALTVLFLFSLLSKESGGLFVPATLLFLFLFRRSELRPGFLAGVLALAGYSCLRFGLAQLGSGAQNIVQIARAPLAVRLLTVPKTVFHYFQTFLFPSTLTTTQDWVVSEPSFESFWLPLSLLTALGVISARYYFRRRDRVFLFFLLWLVMGLGLHLNLVPLDGTVADRWFYFPVIGLLGIFGSLSGNLGGRPRPHVGGRERIPASRPITAAVIGAVLIALSARSYVRSLDWKDGFTLYSHDLGIRPDAYDLNNNLGVELFRRGRIEEAKAYFEKSTRLAPHWHTNWNNLGAACEALGDLDRAEEYYRKSLERSAYYLAYENYAKILLRKERVGEAREFIINRAYPAFPENPLIRELYRRLQ